MIPHFDKNGKHGLSLPKATRNGLLTIKERLLHRGKISRIKPWIKAYDAGVPHEIVIPDLPLTEVLEQAAAQSGKKNAILYYNRKFTYNHLYNLVKRFAGGLKKIGLEKGDRLAICLPNIPQFMISYWAAFYVGAVVIPINPLLSEREIRSHLVDTNAKILIVLDRLYPRIQRIRSQTQLTHVVIACIETYMPPFLNIALQFQQRLAKTNERIRRSSGTMFFRQLLRERPFIESVPLTGNDPAVLLHTGGVTGKPKVAILKHRNLLANVLQARAWINDLREENEILLAVLPFSHSYGMTACHHLAILTRSLLVLEPRFVAERIIKLIKRNKVTLFPGVPTMYGAIVQNERSKRTNLTTIRACICGAAPLPEKIRSEFINVTHCKLVEGYGLTEASPITHCNPLAGTAKQGSIGLPWPNTEARIVDLESGKPLRPSQIGELQVKGPQVMAGYWSSTEPHDVVFSKDGWLKTGDIAFVDKDGYFYLVDRKKDIIFAGGFNVFPSEIEQVLSEHPAVVEAAAVGVADEYYGEVVTAFVVKSKDADVTAGELIAFCSDKLAKFKIPREIRFCADLPKNALGKVIRRELQNACEPE